MQRSSKREKNKLHAFNAKADFLRLGHMLSNTNARPAGFDSVAASSKLKKLDTIIKRADTTSSAQFLTLDLVDKLQTEVTALHLPNASGLIYFVVATFQAELAIAYNANKGLTQMIASTDSDFSILCGSACVLFNSKFPAICKKGQDSITGITLSSPSYATMEKVCKAINREAQDVVTKATMPVLDGRDAWWRALMAVAMGCDQCVGGVPGVNIVTINQWLNPPTDVVAEEKQPQQFLEFLVQSKNCPYTLEGLSACAQAVFFEPGNIEGQTGTRLSIFAPRTKKWGALLILQGLCLQ
jgi:hypothetical protein